MAGLPEEVTERAKKILKNLEGSELTLSGEGKQSDRSRIGGEEIQMTMFEMKDDALRNEIRGLDIDKMTPLEALDKLAELRKRVN
jgi:DNA mismatch repair protein MutS